MKMTIQMQDFVQCDALKNNFSYRGRISLFEYLEWYEENVEEDFDFDPVALRCEYTEYANIVEFWQDYDRYEFQCMCDIENATLVVHIGNTEASEGFIIRQF